MTDISEELVNEIMKQFPIATPTKEEFLTFFGEKEEVKMNKIAQKVENTEVKKMNEAT